MYFEKDLTSAETGSLILPHGIVEIAFDPLQHSKPARRLLNEAYANGGGKIVDHDVWWSSLSNDEEYSPETTLVLVKAATGQMVGFAQCWTSAFVKDIAVEKTHRRLGLGAYMILRLSRHFQAEGFKSIGLKVTHDNPNGTVQFYQELGFEQRSLD